MKLTHPTVRPVSTGRSHRGQRSVDWPRDNDVITIGRSANRMRRTAQCEGKVAEQ
jgi:hypothetical protein